MQRAVAIALAGGLLAASAGAFGLAQVLKLERSPIEAIQVDPTPNHGRGQLDRHDSALFSPRCTRAVPARPRRCASGAHVRARCAPRSSRRAGRSCATSARCRTRAAGSVARWDGRDARGRRRADGSYRLKVSLSGRTIELLNPLALDTAVGVLGTNVSRRVISPDCDSHGDRVTVVVRGREQLAGLQLQVRQGRASSCAPCACASVRARSRSAGRRTPASAARPRRTAATGCA